MAVSVTSGPLEFVAKIDDKQLNASLRRMEANINKSTAAAVRDADRMDAAFRRVGTGIAAYFSVQQLSHFAAQVAHVRGEFQQLEIALETILKSKAEADKLFAEVVQLAAVTPFTFREVADGTKQLLAYGFAADEVIETTRRLGDVSAGLKIPLGDLIYLYGTTRVQQRLYARDLLQFTQRGIPLISELAKQFGVTESQIDEMVTAGEVGFEHVRKAIESLTNEGGTFANLMAKFSETIPGQIARLQDAWQIMLNDIGEENEDTIKSVINLGREAVENYETILGILKVLIATYGTYRAALIATAAAQGLSTAAGNIKAWFELARGIRTAKDAQIAFNLAVRANPIGLIAGAIAGLITYLVVFRDETESLTAAQKNLNDVQIDAAQAVATQEQKLKGLIAVARDETALLTDRRKAISEINHISPEYLGNLNLETVRTDEATEATRRYIDALKDKAIEEAIAAKRTELTRRLIEEQLTPATPTLTDQFLGGALNLFSLNQDRDFAASVVNRRMQTAKNERINGIQQEMRVLEEYAEAQKKTTDVREAEAPVIRRTVTVIDEEIKALKEQQKTVAENRTEWEDFQKKINDLEAEKSQITGELTKGAKKEVKALDEVKKAIQEVRDQMELEPLGKYGQMLAEFDKNFDKWIETARRKSPVLVAELTDLRKDYVSFIQDMILKDNDITSVGEILKPEFGLQSAIDRQLGESLKKSSEAVIAAESQRLSEYFGSLESMTKSALRRTLKVLRQEIRRLQREGFSDEFLDDLLGKAEAIENYLGHEWHDTFSIVSDDIRRISGEFTSMADAVRDVHPEFAEILETLGEIGSVASNIGSSIGSFSRGDIVGGVASALNAITGIFSIGSRRREAERQAREEIASFQTQQLLGEVEINQQYRERLELQNAINEATLEGIRQAQISLDQQERMAQADRERLLRELQSQQYISGTKYIHSTWFRKARTEKQYGSLEGMSFEQIAELAAKGQLEGTALELFNLLKGINGELDGIAEKREDAERIGKEILTGTTATSIADGIIDGFLQGKRAAADFADTFEELMRNSITSLVRDKLLTEGVNDFYDLFADLASDGAIDENDRKILKDAYGSVIESTEAYVDALKGIVGTDISKATQQPGMTGEIRRGITEETGTRLEGLWRGQYDLVKQQLQADLAALDHLNAIEMNTANTVARLDTAVTELQAINANTKQGQTARDLSI